MAAYTLNVTTGSVKIAVNKPPAIVGIVLLPTIGVRILWQRSDGAYHVVIP